MIEIVNPDGSTVHFHENGDRIAVNADKRYLGAIENEYSKGDTGTITQKRQITGHPLDAYFTVMIDGKREVMEIPCFAMKSLEEPRKRLTAAEAEESLISYNKDGMITLERLEEETA